MSQTQKKIKLLKIKKNKIIDIEDKIIKLLSCLNYSRFKYKSWLNVGIIIFNETNNIDIWKEWSKKYNK